MTITIHPELGAKLRERAQAEGITINAYLERLIHGLGLLSLQNPENRRLHSVDQRRAAVATRSAVSSRGWRSAARRGSDVSTTQMVSLAGSAQQSVPVEPV